MGSWRSPGKIWSVGHREVKDLFTQPVQLQEKIDGSFFQFGLVQNDPSKFDSRYELMVRSKGAVMVVDAPMKMFSRVVEQVKLRECLLHPGWTYRGECLDKPNHNALAYDRVPKDHLIIFDILVGEEDYLSYGEMKVEAERIGFEVVPQLFSGMINSADEFRKFLTTPSILGGQLIEGVVAKPLTPVYGMDKKLLMAKFVSEAYKEVHAKSWGEQNPTSGDILLKIAGMYGTPARWNKSIQHLKESGVIVEDRVQNIGAIIKEVPKDVGIECKDEIQQLLWRWAWPHLQRMITKGLPTYYKQRLLESSFEGEIAPTAQELKDMPAWKEHSPLTQALLITKPKGTMNVDDTVNIDSDSPTVVSGVAEHTT